MGFCCMGVAAGSWAATRQAEIGSVPAKSCFSACQSIATNGATCKIIPYLGLIGFITGIVVHFILKVGAAE
jgi:hypothetical protein